MEILGILVVLGFVLLIDSNDSNSYSNRCDRERSKHAYEDQQRAEYLASVCPPPEQLPKQPIISKGFWWKAAAVVSVNIGLMVLTVASN